MLRSWQGHSMIIMEDTLRQQMILTPWMTKKSDLARFLQTFVKTTKLGRFLQKLFFSCKINADKFILQKFVAYFANHALHLEDTMLLAGILKIIEKSSLPARNLQDSLFFARSCQTSARIFHCLARF